MEDATPDECLFLDLDLSILGSTPERYAEYTKEVRKEYTWVNEKTFQIGRRQILEGFLLRKAIYNTVKASQRWEQAAIRNLTWELEHLNGANSV